MMMSMDVPSFLFEQPLAGNLDAGESPILTQFRVDLEEQMDKALLDVLTNELDDYIKRFELCFLSTPSREHLSTYVRGQLGPLKRKSVEPIALEAGFKPIAAKLISVPL